ncbi:MAG TPA: hypothetical protein VGJ22_09865 [Anaerolineales bacterium]|jgi:hypothetical protein
MKINAGPLALLGVCVLLLCAGCDTINHTQYQVLGRPTADGTRLAVSAGQQEAVRQVLQTVAKQLRFADRTARSVVPNTLASYGETDKLNPITFVAYLNKDVILIDIVHKPTEIGESERYRKVQDAILSGLRQRLPPDYVTIPARGSQTRNVASSPFEGTKPNSSLSHSDWPTRPPR